MKKIALFFMYKIWNKHHTFPAFLTHPLLTIISSYIILIHSYLYIFIESNSRISHSLLFDYTISKIKTNSFLWLSLGWNLYTWDQERTNKSWIISADTNLRYGKSELCLKHIFLWCFYFFTFRHCRIIGHEWEWLEKVLAMV